MAAPTLLPDAEARAARNAQALERLRQAFPSPPGPPPPPEDRFAWTLDGGGRHLMDALFRQRRVGVLLEVGSFMGGSALHWLRSSPDLTVVCCDPCKPQGGYIRRLATTRWALRDTPAETLLRYAGIVERHGTRQVLESNLSGFPGRAVVAPLAAPDAYATLAGLGLEPDIVFLDALKTRDEFWLAHQTFPDAMIAGDDWDWRDANGERPVPIHACEVARARGGRVFANRATFLVDEPRFGLTFKDRFAFACG